VARQIITGLEQGQVHPYVFLCGEPERVPKIAAAMEEGKLVRQVREFTIYTAKLGRTPVTIASTGIGGPSTAVLVEELANLGAKTFVRVGTSGGVAPEAEKGSFVISTGAIRGDGTSRTYAWPEYPALAHHEVVLALVEAASELQASFTLGVTFSIDGFYSENKLLLERGELGALAHGGYQLEERLSRLSDVKRMGAKNIEMEAATLFTLAGLYGLRAGAICTVSDVVPWRPTDKIIDFEESMTACIGVAVRAMGKLIDWDRKRGSRPHWYPGLP